MNTRKSLGPLGLVLLLSAVFFVLFLTVSGVLYFKKASKKAGLSRTSTVGAGIFDPGSVGIVELNGVIMDSKRTLKRLENMEENDAIKAVVLRLNSPGGAVAPSQEIYEAVKHLKAKKPVVASMSSVAASGAFYVAMGATKVYANPGTITGSIGVIMEFMNLEKLYEWAKIKRYAIKTGKFKDAGAEFREMTPEEHALLQGMVDDVLMQFKQAVAEGRKLTLAQVTEVADGRIFSGHQAKERKLVDELGTLQDAINEAGKLAKLKGKPAVVYPETPRKGLWNLILEDQKEDEDSETSVPAPNANWLADAVSRLAGVQSTGPSGLALSPGIYWLWNGGH